MAQLRTYAAKAVHGPIVRNRFFVAAVSSTMELPESRSSEPVDCQERKRELEHQLRAETNHAEACVGIKKKAKNRISAQSLLITIVALSGMAAIVEIAGAGYQTGQWIYSIHHGMQKCD